MFKVLILTLMLTYVSASQYNICTGCPEGPGWVGPITIIGDEGVNCKGESCYLFFKYCYRLPDPSLNSTDIEVFICSWGPVTDPRPIFPGDLPCHFYLFPCDTETAMEKVKRFIMSAIAKDLASKGLITDCEFDDEFLIRYIMASCYRTVFENNLQDQMVYILGFEQCEESGTCSETYRYCIDLNEPNGPPEIVFQTKIASEVNQVIQCTTDWDYVPSFNPSGPVIMYGPCFGMCNEANE